MKVTIYSTKDFEISYLQKANEDKHELNLVTTALSVETADLCKGSQAIAIFSGDDASGKVLEKLKDYNIHFVAVRAAGYDNIDLKRAREFGIRVANVPAYSPYAIAEHAVALMMALNRKLIQANQQVHNCDFRLDKLIGFDMHEKTVGIIGTGTIGGVVAKILLGFGCKILAYDLVKNETLVKQGVEYVDIKTLCSNTDIITIHTSLNEGTKYLINKEKISWMKPGVMLINTSRGAVVNTADIIEALKSGIIGSFGMDVYEKEKGLFFYDHSNEVLQDNLFATLLAFRNVLITGHQAFLTHEALTNIASTTIYNIDCWEKNISGKNEL